jgi:hypothetical protein
MPKKAEKGRGRQGPKTFKKEGIFNLYVMWKALPFAMKGANKQTLDKLQVPADDELLRELAGIKTQQQFAKHFGLGPDTLTRWNKSIEDRDALRDIVALAKRLTPNVVMAHYRGATSQSKTAPMDRKNWYTYIEGLGIKLGLDEETGRTLAELISHAQEE